MNTIFNKIKNICLVAALLIAMGSCDKELDVAPILSYDGQATHTIAQLLEMHTAGSADSADPITDSIVIEGTIISSDEHGNCYKYITIQDATGGIQIKIDDSHSFPKYKIGQHVFVSCKGLDLGDYRKNPQLGWWIDGSMSGISSNKEDIYIHKDGIVGPEPEATVIRSIHDIPTDGSLFNCLVKLENCRFTNGGTNPYSAASGSTSEEIVFSDGTSIVMRTSNYADFASEILPSGSGDIYGILTVYGTWQTTYQLTLRSTADVHMTHEETIYSVDLNTNPLDNGWQVKNMNDGKVWTYRNFQGQKLLTIDDEGTATDCWLVSPALNQFGNLDNLTLSFEHKVNDVSSTANMKLYYSTTYNGGAFDPSQWTEVRVPAFYPTRTATTVTFDPSVITNPNFRIAFQYAESNNGWAIYSMKFNSNVSN